MSPTRFIAAAVQVCAGSDKTVNLTKAEAFIEEAAMAGASLVVLPEVFAWRGPREEEASIAESIPGPISLRLAALAAKLRIHMVAGSILERNDQPRPYNSSLLFDAQGAMLACYRKLHLFDVDIRGHISVRESDTRRPGNEVVVVETELGKIGLTICYDLRFPELYRRLTFSGAELVTIPAAFTFPTGAAHWEILVRARAIENQIYVVAPDQIGHSPSGIVDFGSSLIVDPWGTPLARAAEREGVIFAEIDREHQARIRRELPCLGHVRLKPSAD
ncbi:MAG: carbon-nitrogen hydrolase family protein [Deltaproteobacteria bacterium]|nr:carbon-nitrogen hydrolase family protein [Deltaproteobacteria bacterium]